MDLSLAQTLWTYGYLCNVQAQVASVGGALVASSPACTMLGSLAGHYLLLASPADLGKLLLFFILMASLPR
jgi:hypothetical protein